MLRAAIQHGSDVGKKAKSFIDAGDLVPDSVMIELIEKTLGALPTESKIILDGFPRTVAQAKALESNPHTKVDRAIYFEVPQDLLIERLTGRRICSKCGQPFHIHFLPPQIAGICDACGGALLQRPDDSEKVVKHRLEVFTSQTQPLLDFFLSEQKLQKLNADVEVDSLQIQLLKALD